MQVLTAILIVLLAGAAGACGFDLRRREPRPVKAPAVPVLRQPDLQHTSRVA